MDYLEAITKRSIPILLNGQELEVRRANLGLHYRLSVILDQWQGASRGKNYRMSVDKTIDYVALATGLDTERVKQARPFEVLLGFTMLAALNKPSDVLPFMLIERSKEEYIYDYKHRGLADWVATLSAHYGWTAEYVLEYLSPEEAACYLQEALIQDYEDKEFAYRLSFDVAYKIEGKGKSARVKYVPFPKPSWMARKIPSLRVPKAWYPQGNVIDIGNFGQRAND